MPRLSQSVSRLCRMQSSPQSSHFFSLFWCVKIAFEIPSRKILMLCFYQAESKNIPSSQYGIILKSSSFAQVIFAPVCGFVVISLGAIRSYKIGFISFVLLMAAFTFLQLLSTSDWFFAYGFTIRLFSLFGSALMATSGLIILLMHGKTALFFVSKNAEFEIRNPCFWQSWVECSFGLGSVIGTIAGGYSSENSNFVTPLLSISALGVLLWIVALALLPKGKNEFRCNYMA